MTPDFARKLERQESAFQQNKMRLLGLGFMLLALGGFFAFLLVKFHWKFQGSDGAVLAALFVGGMISLFGVGVFMVTVCIRDWHGNKTRLLLLHLLASAGGNENAPNKPWDATGDNAPR
ncbi:hypothetical protein JIN85_19100 [Luteolibacter pohnpeiensis]|uniref:Uncharacterized protein n=1 Tax=Luteolibacter pohnpeiensis TaxID=454153 RepID=A0A934SEA1_9BACT|nr:hypothetical protein [Luteolibacter pohnpeiensis]MBK1884532.1 hypothetical protein [Luteolibacter pohnpeiensis]